MKTGTAKRIGYGIVGLLAFAFGVRQLWQGLEAVGFVRSAGVNAIAAKVAAANKAADAFVALAKD